MINLGEKTDCQFQTKFDRKYGVNSIVEKLGNPEAVRIFLHNKIKIRRPYESPFSVSGKEDESEKSLIIARQKDIVCVPNPVDMEYIQFLSGMGLGTCSKNIVAVTETNEPAENINTLCSKLLAGERSLRKIIKLANRKNIILYPYIASSEEFKLAKVLETLSGQNVFVSGGDIDIIQYALNKHLIKEKAMELKIPVPEGDIVKLQHFNDGILMDISSLKDAVNKHIWKTGKVIIKNSFGVLRSSILIIDENTSDLDFSLKKMVLGCNDYVYLVEAMYDVVCSPNILMNIGINSGEISCVGFTDQLLDGNLAHQGNTYPSMAQKIKHMISASERMSIWLRSEGYTGIAGFDFIECHDKKTGKPFFFLTEINPRVNGSMYPISLMQNLNRIQKREGWPLIEAFIGIKSHKTNSGSFAELCKTYGEYFFKPQLGEGIFPYNIGSLKNGYCSLAAFGKTKKAAAALYKAFCRLN